MSVIPSTSFRRVSSVYPSKDTSFAKSLSSSDSLVAGEVEHGVEEFHGPFGLGLVRYEHLEDAVAERVDILELFPVICQVLRMFGHVLHKGDEFASFHRISI